MERNEENHIRRSGAPVPRRDERRQRIKDTFRRKQYDVTVGKERMDTLDDKSEFTLSVLSSMAQEESRSISTNISWAYKRRFQRGIPLCPTGSLLGYDTDQNGEMYIVRREAEIVKLIYDRYLAGMSFKDIGEMLNQLGHKTVKGNAWSPGSVRGILTNEKYCGDVLNQKTFIEDYLTHRVVKNVGQREMYYIQDHHEAIISRDLFDRAQTLIEIHGGRRRMPVRQKRLYVMKRGPLRGFVPFAPSWTSVALGRVITASLRIMEDIENKRKDELHREREEIQMVTELLKGFEVIDIEKATTESVMTVTQTKLRFNKATAQEMRFPEYAVMSMNPATHQVAIQCSAEATKNAFLFAKEGKETRYSITVDILALANCVRKQMKWVDDADYAVHGMYYAAADAIIFDLETAIRSERKTRKRNRATVAEEAEGEEGKS